MKLIRYCREGFALRALLLACLVLPALVATSCGEDSGETSGPAVTQLVTRNFGNEMMAEERAGLPKIPTTAMRALRDHHDVGTAFQGDVVASIDGVRQSPDRSRTYWQWYVNDIETDPFPSEFKLYPNDVVWWDLRYWHTTRFDTRATVGSFPAMFAHGFEGLNMPTRILCEDDSSPACRRVKSVLRKAGTQFGSGSKSDILHARVLVGKWDHWRDRPWPGDIDRGPIHSGVFARFARDEDALRVLDLKGHRVRSERGDVGLVAATRPTEKDFMWYVTGLNDKGVELAARALDPDRLRRAYALVVTPDGDQKIPVVDRR